MSIAFFFNLIFILLKHRFFPYPSQSQLRKHREEISYADNFSEQLSHRLSSLSVFGPRDIWHFGWLFMFSPKDKKRIVKSKVYLDTQTHFNSREIIIVSFHKRFSIVTRRTGNFVNFGPRGFLDENDVKLILGLK